MNDRTPPTGESAEWSFEFVQQYDFRTHEFVKHSASVRRLFHRFALDVDVSYDPGEKDFSVTASFSPEFLTGEGDAFSATGRFAEITE